MEHGDRTAGLRTESLRSDLVICDRFLCIVDLAWFCSEFRNLGCAQS